ncbi:MAG: hypothetical protein R3F07_17630 [Opitutaceae bacterium]
MSLKNNLLLALTSVLAVSTASAGKKEDLAAQSTIELFKEAKATAPFFESAYAYAVFPSIGKGGIGVGGSYGKGQVFRNGKHLGDTSMTQVTIGFQLGGQAFSQMIFFEDEAAFTEFISGNYEFGAQVSAVALTAGIEASAGTGGTTAGASAGSDSAHAQHAYSMGVIIFTIAKGGLMYEASIGGQKFKYHALD